MKRQLPPACGLELNIRSLLPSLRASTREPQTISALGFQSCELRLKLQHQCS